MSEPVMMVIGVLLVGGAMFISGFLIARYWLIRRARAAEEEVERLLEEAQSKSREMILEAKAEALRIRDEAEAENKKGRAELRRQEQRLRRGRESLERRLESLDTRMRRLEAREGNLDEREKELEEVLQRQIRELERISGLGPEEAKEVFLTRVAEEARQDAARTIREIELRAKEEAERKAREIIATAMQRCASDQVAEMAVSTVFLPSDEMKGRIIGRGGRNIRAIENVTGVDLVVDDTPEAVLISSLDPVRREVARVALTKLVMDGRIHPARIEKVVKDARTEVETIIREEGKRVALEMGLAGLHPELIELVGQLKFRTSLGQNVLGHSMETAYLAAMMAGELGADIELAKQAGLLHDIGKAVDHRVEGPHALIGADIARRLNKSPELINAIASHHGEEEPQSVEAILVQVADAISGARPGARRENLESYIKRIKALEEVADSFPGVSEAYAIQAGREIRIIVEPEEIDDLAAICLSKEIARKVEESLEYPGEIKVTVIRETRAVDYAR